jgi:hypothetical protein
MSYSRIKPHNIGKITMKCAWREGDYYCGWLVCNSFDGGKTWLVWNHETRIVEAIFYSEPNGNGWSASEAHAKSYVNCNGETINPFELDSIP